MKRFLLYSLCLLLLLQGHAQNAPDSLWQLARRADSLQQPAEAIRLYLLAAALSKDSVEVAILQSQAGRRMIRSAKPGQEQAAYRDALFLGAYNVGRSKLYQADILAGMYLRDRLYDSALFVLRYAKSLPQLRRGCGMGLYGFYAGYHYKMMRAFEGMGQLDSAIQTFLPYAFDRQESEYGYTSCHIAEDDYHCQVSGFLKLLRRRYSPEDLRTAFRALVARSSLRVEREVLQGNRKTFEAALTLHFLGRELQPFGYTYYDDAAQLRAEEAVQKDWLRASVLYECYTCGDKPAF